MQSARDTEGTRAGAGGLGRARRYGRAAQARVVALLGPLMDLLMGGFFGALFLLFLLELSGFRVSMGAVDPWWRYLAATVCVGAAVTALRPYAVRAHRAWAALRDRMHGHAAAARGRKRRLTAARAGVANP